LNSLSTTVVII